MAPVSLFDPFDSSFYTKRENLASGGIFGIDYVLICNRKKVFLLVALSFHRKFGEWNIPSIFECVNDTMRRCGFSASYSLL